MKNLRAEILTLSRETLIVTDWGGEMSGSLDVEQLLIDDLQVLWTPLTGAVNKNNSHTNKWSSSTLTLLAQSNTGYYEETLISELSELTLYVGSWWAEHRDRAETAATELPAARPPNPSHSSRGWVRTVSLGSGRTACPCRGNSTRVSLWSRRNTGEKIKSFE